MAFTHRSVCALLCVVAITLLVLSSMVEENGVDAQWGYGWGYRRWGFRPWGGGFYRPWGYGGYGGFGGPFGFYGKK